MIVNATIRGPGGLARHLERVDTNERVRTREDLSFDCAFDTTEAIADFAAMGLAQKIEKSLVHISVSPALPLTLSQEKRMIELIREVYGVSSGQPCHVKEHFKPGETGRPGHIHVIFPRYDHGRGGLIPSSFIKIKNERISTQAELEFGHPVVPGPHIASVRKSLERERPDLARLISALTAPERINDQLKVSDKAQAHDHDLDLAEFGDRVLKAWRADGLGARSLAEARLRLAHGDKAVMVVDLDTGSSHSLVRILNAASKKSGAPLRLKPSDLDHVRGAIPEADTLARVRKDVLPAAVEKSGAEHDESLRAAKQDALSAFDIDLVRRITREQREADMARQRARVDAKIKSQVEAIRTARQEARRVRQETISRAYRTLRFWRAPAVARGAGIAVALLTGSVGIGIAAVAATAMVRGVERWRARRAISQARSAPALTSREEIRRYFDDVKAARQLDPEAIPVHLRILAGALYRAVDEGVAPDSAWVTMLNNGKPGLAEQILDFAQYNASPILRSRMLAMFDSESAAHAHELQRAVTQANGVGGGPTPIQAPSMPATPPPQGDMDRKRALTSATSAPMAPFPVPVSPADAFDRQRAGVVAAAAPLKPDSTLATRPSTAPFRAPSPESPPATRTVLNHPVVIPKRASTNSADPGFPRPSPAADRSGSSPVASLPAPWSAAAIPAQQRALAGVYAQILLFGSSQILANYGPALKTFLGPHAREVRNRIHVIKKGLRDAAQNPSDQEKQRAKAKLTTERAELLAMANALRANEARFVIDTLKLVQELKRHGLEVPHAHKRGTQVLR
ncbi:hypothetical protein GJ654_12445 [Rhodoblastus acidophilus]|uniref:Uncharacterized protein n=1 Tax=Rhodoblastus acidophilus TaxID=1074 RepID=A0A6N8DQH2_RHOAC|nr:hypothetical protein [Rhodoblastus acidophilus]MCW2275312.1 hypothetical protein [Rhodoblastus acidophilus]MTV31795.1 hypothetical protein [Rhodoblastus acidophilus]